MEKFKKYLSNFEVLAQTHSFINEVFDIESRSQFTRYVIGPYFDEIL